MSKINFRAACLLSAAVLVRMIGLGRPLLGNFAVYQTAQAMISRFLIEGHFKTLLYPQVNVLAAGKPGLMLLYFPVSSFLAAVFTFCLGFPLDLAGKFQAVLFFLFSAIYLYRLVKLLWDESAAFVSLVIFCLLPLTIIYGQSFQNEMSTVFFTVFFFFYLERLLVVRFSPRSFFLCALGLTGILLTRPNCLYVGLPAVYLIYSMNGEKKTKRLMLLKFAAICLLGTVLPALWYTHLWRVSQAHSNIYSTLFAQMIVRSSFVSPLVLHADFYKSLFDILCGVVLTPIGATFALIGCGLAFSKGRAGHFFLLWTASAFFSSLLIPRKLIDHDFYWLHFVLPVTPIIALGVRRIFSAFQTHFWGSLKGRAIFLALCFLISMRYSFFPAFVTPQAEKVIPALGQTIQKITPRDAKIVVQGTHSLLYYADRYGWALTVSKPRGEISDYMKYMNWEKLPQDQWERRNKAFETPSTALEYLQREEGAAYFIATNLPELFAQPEFLVYLQSNYRLIAEEKGKYQIYQR